MDEVKPPRKKFRHTKELVKIALDAGMTQEQIAKLCRTQQSVVSAWKGGKTRAFEDVIAPLLKRYSARLNRTTSRVYLVGARVAAPAEGDHSVWQWPASPEVARGAGIDRAGAYREDFGGQEWPPRLARVEGPIVLRYTFSCITEEDRRGKKEFVKIPVRRWIVHRQSNGGFLLVHQRRRALYGKKLERWKKNLPSEVQNRLDPWVDANDDAARWLSSIEGAMDPVALVAWVDSYLKDPKTAHGPHDEMVLPFLVRKALVELGCEVLGVDHIGGGAEEE